MQTKYPWQRSGQGFPKAYSPIFTTWLLPANSSALLSTLHGRAYETPLARPPVRVVISIRSACTGNVLEAGQLYTLRYISFSELDPFKFFRLNISLPLLLPFIRYKAEKSGISSKGGHFFIPLQASIVTESASRAGFM